MNGSYSKSSPLRYELAGSYYKLIPVKIGKRGESEFYNRFQNLFCQFLKKKIENQKIKNNLKS